MKVAYRDTTGFLNNPPDHIRVILVYGPDYGLMKERAKIIGKNIVEDLNDPFNVSVIDADQIEEDAALLSAEANATSMMGGRRLVLVDKAVDKIEPSLKLYLSDSNPNSLIILQAENLSPQSKLRKLCETHKQAAALACYVEEERDLASLITSILIERGNYRIDRDALNWLSTSLKGDRRRVRNEIEKLTLYKGSDTTQITLDEAMKACGDSGQRSLDDLVYACSGRQADNALKIYNELVSDGVAGMAILRSLQNHFRRLYLVKQLMSEGNPFSVASKSLTPPLFFKVEKTFESHVNRWSEAALIASLSKLMDLESLSKKTGYNEEVYVGQFIAGLGLTRAA